MILSQNIEHKTTFSTDKTSEKPMLAITEGAGILSHRLGDEYEPPLDNVPVLDEISFSTNHNYFIQLQDDDGESYYEKIIEKQMPLPVSLSRVFKTTVQNQKIAHIKLFSDIENKEKELQSHGFYAIEQKS